MGLLPGPGAAARGMVPDTGLTADPRFDDPGLAAAVSAALAGDWHPAAALVASLHGDWDRRTAVVDALATTATTERQWLRDWLAARDGDPDATVVQAQTFVALAWQRRGSAWGRHTSRQQFGPFFQFLEHAADTAWKAAELAEADPTPWATLVSVATGLGVRYQPFDGIWTGLIVRAPAHRPGHERALRYWCPKWHGTEERLLDFATGAAAMAPSLTPLPLRAAFEMAMEGTPIWRSRYVQEALDTALPWLDGEGADHPSAREDRGYAIYALHHNGRHDEAVAQFRKLGGHAGGYVWNFTTDVTRAADPVKQFAALRAKTCRHASRDA
ncbi:DUF4034 domain-containing protein [Amycolatopsis sp. SID8362]|uniref:DUF4034 domain-containing protein n=1 Tax=Amycolatopsis sp. SID8362 TaxID=2690346 RepID=UPI00136D0554|nr:DUF4034 domain-containing protein [Amycolatopsis sp. SID8362]NBH08646.1 DUF4034 domain-containing protein [Amycolatopsis sp. SID8362]NED45340.1 DUF4034 domain-containing protein [Amycolatopsis sp. SID8362]